VVALCNVNPAMLGQRMKKAEALSEKPFATHDARRLFDRADVDAVVIATPNHTYAVLASWAIQAGKDVYVEKPVCHDIDEGIRLLAVQQRTGRIVAAGTQNRSDIGIRAAFTELHAGTFGAIKGVRGFCFRDRKTIGKVDAPIKPPNGLDYDLWLGPAADLPLMRPQFHYDWHWIWNTGNGDLGNQGPHELDMACWALGDLGYPQAAVGVGGRFDWHDAGETANLMTAWYRFANGIPLVFEVRNLPPKNVEAGAWHGLKVPAVTVECADGELRAQRGGAAFFDPTGKQVQEWKGDGGATHQANFIEAVRTGKPELLHAPLAKAVVTAGLAHIGNASLRIGSVGGAAEATGAATGRVLLGEHIERMLALLKDYGTDLTKEPMAIGPELAIDPLTGLVTGAHATAANPLLQRQPRPGWQV
ncbi:MAG TPA: Gfo/Idh/MocA family oxidoreductase, partial [Planctomycetota bacterium]|nr:Gfo/Idh/MocA family oxidoreductase [Planctomycetota bacterium]